LDEVWALDFDCAAAFLLLHLESKAMKRAEEGAGDWPEVGQHEPLPTRTRKWSTNLSAEEMASGAIIQMFQVPG